MIVDIAYRGFSVFDVDYPSDSSEAHQQLDFVGSLITINGFATKVRADSGSLSVGHLDNDPLDIHVMNATMDSQQGEAILADYGRVIVRHKFNDPVIRPNLKPETASYGHRITKPLTRF